MDVGSGSMNFFCVYVKTRKKFDKFIKVNRIKNKYIIDIRKIIEEEEVEFKQDKTYLKILIFNKIQQAIERKKDIYVDGFINLIGEKSIISKNKSYGPPRPCSLTSSPPEIADCNTQNVNIDINIILKYL